MTFCKVSSYQLKMIRGYPSLAGNRSGYEIYWRGIDISNFDKNLI